jgi:hypothetical protein
MERDRAIVTLSTAGIGLLVTLLTAVGVKHQWEIFLYAGGFAALGASTYLSLAIFQLNSKHIASAIHGSSEEDPVLVQYDRALLATFLVGLFFIALISIASAIDRIKGDSAMSTKPNGPQTTGVLTGDSVNGIGGLAPQGPLGKSLSGIGSLKPPAPIGQPSSAATTPVTQAAPQQPTAAAATTQPKSEGK